MKSNYKIFTAVFLFGNYDSSSSVNSMWGGSFSAGESFSDGTGEYSCHIDRYGSAGWRDWNGISGTA